MNKNRAIAFFGVLMVAASSMADLKSDTQKQFDKYCAAVKNKDPKGIEKVLRDNFAPDFKFIPTKGKNIGLTEWIADEQIQSKMTQSVKSVSLHTDSVKIGKGVATMHVTLRYEGWTKLDPKGKVGLLKYNATSEQTMVRKNGKWWITEMKQGTSNTTFNGKTIAM